MAENSVIYLDQLQSKLDHNSIMLKIFVVIVLSCVWVLSSQAEDFRNLKGSREFLGLTPQCEYLSPDIALGLTRQGKILNDYLYAEENHPGTELVKTAFNIPPTSENAAFLQISPQPKNIARFLAPSTVGKLLRVLHGHPAVLDVPALEALVLEDQGFKDRVKLAREELERAVSDQQAYLKNLEEQIQKLDEAIEKGRADLRAQKGGSSGQKLSPRGSAECSPREASPVLTSQGSQLSQDLDKVCSPPIDLKPLLAELKEKKALIDGLEARRLASAVNRARAMAEYDPTALRPFLEKIAHSFQAEEQKPPVGRYLRPSTEQTLLSIGWLNTGDSKGDLLKLYEEIPQCLTLQGSKNIFGMDAESLEKREKWLNDKYTAADYEKLAAHLHSMTATARAEYLLARPEELALLAYGRSYYDKNALPTLGYKQVTFTLQSGQSAGKQVSMPDCMEYSILNSILNALTGGPGNTFEVGALKKKLAEEGYQMHPKLEAFLEKFPSPADVNEMGAHVLWDELITGIPGIEPHRPLQPTHEMKPTVGNALLAYQYLFYSHPLPNAKPKGTPWVKLTRSEQLDRVFSLLSRETPTPRIFKWKLRDGKKEDLNELDDHQHFKKNTDLVLEFKIKNGPRYDWRIEAAHAQVDPKKDDAADWRKGIGPAMARKISDHNKESSEMPHQARSSLAWVLKASDAEETFRGLSAFHNDPTYEDLIWRMSSESVDEKLVIIGQMVEALNRTSLEKEKEKESIHKLIKTLHGKLPLDLDPQRRFHATLADHHYPFQKTERSKVTGVSFTQLEEHPVLGKGKFWRDDARGTLWGETEKDEYGKRRR